MSDNMRHQRRMLQKGPDKNPQDWINEEEVGNSEKESRVLIVSIIQDLRNRMETWINKIQEVFNKDLEELKNKH